MAKLKLHYDGWLSLPSGMIQQLGLKTGDRLVAELVDSSVVLRPASASATSRRPAGDTKAPHDSPSTFDEAPPSAEPAKRGRGRPRKTAGDSGAPRPKPIKARGRPRTTQATPDSHPVPGAEGATGPARLIRRADLPAVALPPEEPPRPARPARADNDAHFVERRPFRQVEIRKLQTGRGHNRPQRFGQHSG